MARKTPEQEATEFANNRKEKVAPSMARKLGNAVVAGAIVVGGVFGIGKAGENDRQSEQMTQHNNEQILDAAQNAGRIAGENMTTEVKTDIGYAKEMKSVNGEVVEVNPATGEPADPALKEQDAYTNSKAFQNGGGVPDLRDNPGE